MNYELVISISAISISLISIIVSIFFSWSAREHNRKSVLPYPYLDRSDFDDKIQIRLLNHGTGPMIVTKLTVSHPDTKPGQLIDIIPPAQFEFSFSNFCRLTDERAVLSGDALNLLIAHFDYEDDQHVEYRQTLRRFLKDCTINVEYTNVYRSKFDPYITQFKWYGRHFEEDN